MGGVVRGRGGRIGACLPGGIAGQEDYLLGHNNMSAGLCFHIGTYSFDYKPRMDRRLGRDPTRRFQAWQWGRSGSGNSPPSAPRQVHDGKGTNVRQRHHVAYRRRLVGDRIDNSITGSVTCAFPARRSPVQASMIPPIVRAHKAAVGQVRSKWRGIRRSRRSRTLLQVAGVGFAGCRPDAAAGTRWPRRGARKIKRRSTQMDANRRKCCVRLQISHPIQRGGICCYGRLVSPARHSARSICVHPR